MLATALDAPLVRLQCYEGLTASEALYDWNYQRQLLAIRLAEAQAAVAGEADLFSEEFLVERPILRCIRYDGPRAPVLLIDEIDRADDEFEALLLEVLGEGSVTVPELGTFTAVRPPIVVLTSNRSRDLHDALRGAASTTGWSTPSVARACAILRRGRCPAASDALVSAATASSGTCASSTSTSRRAWPRRSTGWRRSRRSAPPSSSGTTCVRTLGAVVKTPDDRDLVVGLARRPRHRGGRWLTGPRSPASTGPRWRPHSGHACGPAGCRRP